MVQNHRELVLVLVLRTSVVLVPVMDLVLVYGFVAGSLLGNGLEEKMSYPEFYPPSGKVVLSTSIFVGNPPIYCHEVRSTKIFVKTNQFIVTRCEAPKYL